MILILIVSYFLSYGSTKIFFNFISKIAIFRY